jgi:uncharacterized protein DUF4062
MEKKHQVFVSSTYKDLIVERQQVIHALLELDCIPAGMELFPATDEDAWSLIKEVIDGCDYYILIVAGLYGSTNSEGISFTEIEYDYAISINKPIISFLHSNLGSLQSSKTEKTEVKQKKLLEFREKAEKKHCKYWKTPEDLGGKVSRSLIQLRKKHPSFGWVPGKYAADEKMLIEFEQLRTRVLELEYESQAIKNEPPPNTEDLEQGNDKLVFVRDLILSEGDNNQGEIKIEATYDKLFSYAGTALIGECSEKVFTDKITLAYWHSLPPEICKLNQYLILPSVLIDQLKIQFQALGLMMIGKKKRTASDTNVYWKLTPYGEKYLLQIRARKKEV